MARRFNELRRKSGAGLRRAMHLYWRFARGMTLGVRAVVVNEAGEIFLVEHSYVSGWHLPGGGVEPDETLAAALARELLEEGNIVATAPPVLHAVYFNDAASRRDHVALYVVRAFGQERMPAPGREIVACGFFARDSLPEDTTAGTRRRIAEVLDGVAPTETW